MMEVDMVGIEVDRAASKGMEVVMVTETVVVVVRAAVEMAEGETAGGTHDLVQQHSSVAR